MGFDMTSINSALSSTTGKLESDLRTKLNASKDGDIDQTEMLALQTEISKWQLVTSLQSNIMKTLSEAVKGTISNMR
jgi:hypothetical protein